MKRSVNINKFDQVGVGRFRFRILNILRKT